MEEINLFEGMEYGIKKRAFTSIDLFAGIGGIRLGFEQAFVGNISDFSTIRFMRMFMTGFRSEEHTSELQSR